MNVVQAAKINPLRLDLLKQSYEVETNWIVITGAPCSGKTTALSALSKRGYDWYPEIARTCIEARLAKGEALIDIRKNEGQFQRSLIDAKLALEASCDPKETLLFDRALPDSITYYRVAGLNPNDVLPHCFHNKYLQVFIFDPIPFQADHARIEDSKTISYLNIWLEKDYIALGYDVIRVPIMSVQERVEYILRKIKPR